MYYFKVWPLTKHFEGCVVVFSQFIRETIYPGLLDTSVTCRGPEDDALRQIPHIYNMLFMNRRFLDFHPIYMYHLINFDPQCRDQFDSGDKLHKLVGGFPDIAVFYNMPCSFRKGFFLKFSLYIFLYKACNKGS